MLWKFFRDRYDYKSGRRICLEVAQNCPQCQMGSDYGHRQKTTGAIQSQGPWDLLSTDIVGPLPADHRQEFLIVLVDCYSRYTILVPSGNHTANKVSEALLRHVVPYFGTPRRLLSDRGREFVGEIWGKLLRSLGIQRVMTSPYHSEGNAINERSHRMLNNMLRARLLEGTSSNAWVEKVPGIMLTLNAMSHEPHGFSASMVVTGQEPTLPPDVQQDAHASPSVDDPADYVEILTQRLKLTHQQMATPSPPAVANPYQEGSLIYTMTTPAERSNKLTPRWKGPFRVWRIPNEYQVVYEDGAVWRTAHINHTKPAKFTALDLPEPVPASETPCPSFGYLPSGLLGPRPPPPASAAPAEGSAFSPTASVPAQLPAAPAASEMQPPATAPANQQPASTFRPRRSPRINPEPGRVCAIKGPSGNLSPQSEKPATMARTYPLTVPYNQCLDARTDRLSFSSLYLEDLKSGRSQYLSSMKQLAAALPKMENPTSRFALRGHIARPGQKWLRHSMRAAMWWVLPSDGEFCRSSHSLQYYLTRQGRRVVLRGGDVTLPLLESYLNWVADPMPPPTRRLTDLTSPVSSENTPPTESSRKLPRRLQPRRRRGKQSTLSANENSASSAVTQPRLTANRNLESAWNQPAHEEYPSGASSDLPAPTALTVPQPEDQ